MCPAPAAGGAAGARQLGATAAGLAAALQAGGGRAAMQGPRLQLAGARGATCAVSRCLGPPELRCRRHTLACRSEKFSIFEVWYLSVSAW